jgi:tRNA(fMet)-specific endonuclease VapC
MAGCYPVAPDLEERPAALVLAPTTARSILEEAVNLDARRQRLTRYATWSAADVREFDQAVADQRVIDDAGDARVHDLIADAEIVIVPTIVLGELWGAFEQGTRARENRVTLDELLAESLVRIAEVSPAVARQDARVYAELRRAGTPIPVNDIWIAASALDQGACLLTFDHDFDRVADLDRIVLDGIEPGTED